MSIEPERVHERLGDFKSLIAEMERQRQRWLFSPRTEYLLAQKFDVFHGASFKRGLALWTLAFGAYNYVGVISSYGVSELSALKQYENNVSFELGLAFSRFGISSDFRF